MSTIYNLEPQPTASAIIHTTLGELSIELFAKQTPLTCRNFLQHALDGYYDNTIFHRLVPGFILQGGDPTSTGNGGESIYDGGAFSGDLDPWPMDQRQGKNGGPHGIGFKDEFHSRLKFNRRGLLGMANEGAPNTNGSQFFFTLDKAEELNQKNTMFGRVAGNTIYNLAKMGEAEAQEGTDRPMYPVRIVRIEILINPFEDMRKRERIAKATQKPAPADKKKKKKVGKPMLSFGDDEGDEEVAVITKPKYDTRIVMDVDEDTDSTPKPMPKPKPKKQAKAPEAPLRDDSPPPAGRKPSPPPAKPTRSVRDMGVDSGAAEPEPEPPKKKSRLEKTNDEIAALKAAMRRDMPPETVREEPKKMSGIERFMPDSSIRGRKRKKPTGVMPGQESQALRDLKAFMTKLDNAPAEKKVVEQARSPEVDERVIGDGEGEEELCDLHFIAGCLSCRSWDKEDKEESDDEGWMSHTLTVAPDKLGKDLNFKKKAEEELIVIDPREKTKALMNEKRAARESKSGTGREWDQARNAQLARASALAGRGAR